MIDIGYATPYIQGMDQEFEFRLDNAAKIFAAQHSKRRTTMFRLSADLSEPVNLDRLTTAYEHMLIRCPYYRVQLRRGLFWYYIEPCETKAHVEAESRYPCMYIPFKRRGMLPFRVLAYKQRIIFEVAHLITDGTGALEFLNGIILEYLRLGGHEVPSEHMVLDCREPLDPAEFEDSFQQLYEKGIPGPVKTDRAYQVRGRALRVPRYDIIEGIMESDALKLEAKKYGATIGEFLTALLLDTLMNDMLVHSRRKKPVRISIPINLRKMFPSQTMRNFALTIEPGIDPRLGSFSFEEIVEKVRQFMKMELDQRSIKRQIARNVGSERNPFVRIIPLSLKDPILRKFYERFGSITFTLSLSNLGRVELPEGMKEHVRAYQFIPPPHGRKLSVTSIAYGGKTSIIFGSTITNTEIERSFFSQLRKMGIHVTIKTNRR